MSVWVYGISVWVLCWLLCIVLLSLLLFIFVFVLGSMLLLSVLVDILVLVSERVLLRFVCLLRFSGFEGWGFWGGCWRSIVRLVRLISICMWWIVFVINGILVDIVVGIIFFILRLRVIDLRISVFWWSIFIGRRLRSFELSILLSSRRFVELRIRLCGRGGLIGLWRRGRVFMRLSRRKLRSRLVLYFY